MSTQRIPDEEYTVAGSYAFCDMAAFLLVAPDESHVLLRRCKAGGMEETRIEGNNPFGDGRRAFCALVEDQLYRTSRSAVMAGPMLPPSALLSMGGGALQGGT